MYRNKKSSLSFLINYMSKIKIEDNINKLIEEKSKKISDATNTGTFYRYIDDNDLSFSSVFWMLSNSKMDFLKVFDTIGPVMSKVNKPEFMSLEHVTKTEKFIQPVKILTFVALDNRFDDNGYKLTVKTYVTFNKSDMVFNDIVDKVDKTLIETVPVDTSSMITTGITLDYQTIDKMIAAYNFVFNEWNDMCEYYYNGKKLKVLHTQYGR